MQAQERSAFGSDRPIPGEERALSVSGDEDVRFFFLKAKTFTDAHIFIGTVHLKIKNTEMQSSLSKDSALIHLKQMCPNKTRT
jgi:hypothetical protein